MARKLELIADAPRLNAGGMPDGLGAHGQQLWRRIMAEFVIEDSAALEVLAQCSHAADMAVRCRQHLDEHGLVLRTKAGARENPMLRHELAYRSFVTRCLQKLGVLTEPLRDGPGRPPSSLA